jgi:hypothetical protein
VTSSVSLCKLHPTLLQYSSGLASRWFHVSDVFHLYPVLAIRGIWFYESADLICKHTRNIDSLRTKRSTRVWCRVVIASGTRIQVTRWPLPRFFFDVELRLSPHWGNIGRTDATKTRQMLNPYIIENNNRKVKNNTSLDGLYSPIYNKTRSNPPSLNHSIQ